MSIVKKIIRKGFELTGYTIIGKENLKVIKNDSNKKNDEITKLNKQISSIFNPCIANKNTFSFEVPVGSYAEDGLVSFHNHDFLYNPKFKSAYRQGIKAAKEDYLWRWRVHVGLWAAAHAAKLKGSFVECGVNRGFLSTAIMHYLNWNKLNKEFFLFDTFSGLDKSLVSKEEIKLGRMKQSYQKYSECYNEVRDNFKKFKNVKLIRGSVPSTLEHVNISLVSYLSIDMNNAKPEIAAAEFFWTKLEKGALVLLDDYAFIGYTPQKKAFDKFAAKKNIEILSLPTGQGIFIKP